MFETYRFEMNLDKTKIMYNNNLPQRPVIMNGAVLKFVQEYVSFGQTKQIGWYNFDKKNHGGIQQAPPYFRVIDFIML